MAGTFARLYTSTKKAAENSNVTCAMIKSGDFTGNGHGPPLIGKFSLIIWVFGKKAILLAYWVDELIPYYMETMGAKTLAHIFIFKQ